MLHIAPEPGIQRRLRRALRGAYRSADLSWPLADDLVDVQQLPYADAAFDRVVMSHVLAHVVNDREALRELIRVLDVDGRFILQEQIFQEHPTTLEAPRGASPDERQRLLGQPDRWRQYGSDLVQRLEKVGFVVETVDLASDLSINERALLGLGRYHPQHPGVIFVCSHGRT